MSETPAPVDSPPSGSWVHYLLAFTSFALVVLALMAGKIEKRQTRIEQQFHGIQEMQRRQSGRPPDADPVTPEQRPALVTLRPLMFVLSAVLFVAWIAMVVRRLQRRRVRPPGEPPVERPAIER